MPRWRSAHSSTPQTGNSQWMDPILQGLQHCIMDKIARNTDSTGTSATPTTGVTFTLHLVLMPIPTGWKVSLEFRFPPIPTVLPPPQPTTHKDRKSVV